MEGRFKNFSILSIFIVAILVRFMFIKEIPPGLANDELNIIMNAQSLLKTGNNIPGVTTGILGNTGGDLSMGIHSEVSSYIITPFLALFGLNSVSAKIPFILASLGIVVVGYFLTKKLVNKNAALIAVALLAINPWLIFFGRSAYESIFSSFFYLLSIYLIVQLKGMKKIFALIPLVLGFFSYYSAKTLMFPITFILTLWYWFYGEKESKKPLIILSLVTLIISICYGTALLKNPDNLRINELKLKEASQQVIAKRTASINTFFGVIFENKYVEEMRTRTTRSLGMLNPVYLFINGQPEATPSLSIPDHGFLYFIDLFLVIVGLIYLYRHGQKQLILILGLIATTLIPNFLNLQGTTYSIRTVILFPLLVILSAIGLYSIKNRFIKILTVIGYLVFFANFLFIYFNRLPIDRNTGWFLPEKILSQYILRTVNKNPNQRIIIVTQNPKLLFYKYIFYSGIYKTPQQIKVLNNALLNQKYEVGNVQISANCETTKSIDKNTTLINYAFDCETKKYDSTIKSLSDAGDIYLIQNDVLCPESSKNIYPLVKAFSQLNLDGQNDQDFCKNYISSS